MTAATPATANWPAALTAVAFWLATLPAALPWAAAEEQAVRESLFQTAERARQAALDADAERLSPEAWSRGDDAYARAQSDYERGRALERIRRSLNDASEAFEAAAATASSNANRLGQVLEARERARQADAHRLTPDRWQDAERRLRDVSARLERGDDRAAGDPAEALAALYAEVELTAIEGRVLSRARAEVTEAQRNRVQRDAPLTLQRAEDLLAQAQQRLAEDRYDTGPARLLADEAAREARHATYLAQRVRTATSRGGSVEEALLDYAAELARIAGEAGVDAGLDRGPAAAGDALTAYVRSLQARASAAELRAEETARLALSLEDEIRELDSQLGGVARERTALVQRLEAQERVQRQFRQLEELFAPSEATVLREGDTVILRLIGLNFPSGSAELTEADHQLLDKLVSASNVFPQARLTIEGHTDSVGSNELNQRLSQDRAEAVRQYLADRHGLPSHRLAARGFGPERPVASNETPEGRARNRRIDVTIPTGTR